MPEKRPEPNSTAEPLPVPLSNRDLSSSQTGAKEQNSSSDPAEGTNTCFLWSWGMLSLCWGEFRAPIKPGEHSLLFLTAQKARKKICFLPLVATKFHQWFLQKPKGKRFSWIRERETNYSLETAPFLNSPISFEPQMLEANHRYFDLLFLVFSRKHWKPSSSRVDSLRRMEAKIFPSKRAFTKVFFL